MMTKLRLDLFGNPEVFLDDVPVTAFESTKVQALLYYLAVTGRSHSREILAALLWSEMPETTAKRNLTKALTNLRHLLGASYLLVERHSVAFNQAMPCVLDVSIFQAAVKGCLMLEPDKLEQEVAPLRQAVNLYQGDFLEGFHIKKTPEFDEWAWMQQEQLRQLMLQALQMLTDHYARSGSVALALEYAHRWLHFEPWQETAHRQVMRLLARSGQRNAALAHYETCRQVLANELGVEPLAETTALYERLKTATQPSAALPAETTPFVGRKAELAKIETLLTNPDCRLLTLTGLGGMGKTRLALEVARRLRKGPAVLFLNGVAYVPLAGVQAVESLPVAVAKGLGLTLSGRFDPSEEVLQHLQHQELLLVLDNFEHLLGPGSPPLTPVAAQLPLSRQERELEDEEPTDGSHFLRNILEQCAGVKLLVTSRKPLNLMAEWRLDIEGLSYPALVESKEQGAATTTLIQYDATHLFLQTAAQVRPNFQLKNEAEALIIHRLCHLVAGIPLAIKLAAIWLRVMSLAQIMAKVESGLDILRTTLADLPPRQRSMRAIFDQSWRLLTVEEQKIFQTLSIFQGGFDEVAAEAVTEPSPFLLAGLVDSGLVQVSNSAAGLRYELHELTRQYAAEKLQTEAERPPVWQRHSDYYLNFVSQQATRFQGNNLQPTMATLHLELDNIRQAWQEAVTAGRVGALETALDSLSRFYDLAGLFQEGETLFGRAAASLQSHFAETDTKAKQAAQTTIVKLWVEQARLLNRRGLSEQALQIMPRAAELAHRTQNIALEAIAHHQWGETLSFYGDPKASQAQLEKALHLARAGGLCQTEAESLRHLGIARQNQGDTAGAIKLYQEALACYSQLKDQRGEGLTLNVIGVIAREEGRYAEAQTAYEQAFQIFCDISYLWGQDVVLNNLGNLKYDQIRYSEAERLCRQGLQICREINDYWGESHLLNSLGNIKREQGDYVTAQTYYERCLHLRREIGAHLQAGVTLAEWALLLHQIGHNEQAQNYSRQAEQIGQEAGSANIRALALTHLGHAQAALADQTAAKATYEQALTLRLELKQPHRMIEVEAGLARVSLSLADLSTALQHVKKILPSLEDDNFYGTQGPGRIFLTCYQVLLAAQDARAQPLLETAHRLLQQWATNIEDEPLRRSFLENIPAHRELIKLAQIGLFS